MVAIATASSHRSPSHRSPSRPSRPVLVVLPPVTRPGARMYRRRRLAVVAAALSLLLLPALVMVAAVASTTVHPETAPASAPAVAPAASVYVVQPGDTLWSIAHQVEPQADPRDVVDRLVELNGSGALQPGQRLRLTRTER